MWLLVTKSVNVSDIRCRYKFTGAFWPCRRCRSLPTVLLPHAIKKDKFRARDTLLTSLFTFILYLKLKRSSYGIPCETTYHIQFGSYQIQLLFANTVQPQSQLQRRTIASRKNVLKRTTTSSKRSKANSNILALTMGQYVPPSLPFSSLSTPHLYMPFLTSSLKLTNILKTPRSRPQFSQP